MSVAFVENMELIFTVGLSFIVGIGYGVWLANDIRDVQNRNHVNLVLYG